MAGIAPGDLVGAPLQMSTSLVPTFPPLDPSALEGVEPGMCVPCKGTKLLCGKERCPLVVRYAAAQQTSLLLEGLELQGSSPTAVFVGRMGYPKVFLGPLVAAQSGDTSLLDTPERWIGRSIDEIVAFRSQLVRGMHRVDALDVEGGGALVQRVRELALARRSADVEVAFHKRPVGRLVFDDEVQPTGPTAPLRGLEVGTLRIDRRVERAHLDTDLGAAPALVGLYRSGLELSALQRMFSVGAFGDGRRRRFVPTRWSITAVDSTVGEHLRERVKQLPTIDQWRIHEIVALDNRWQVVLMPSSWRYELVEAWYPNTAWNPLGREVEIISDHEFYEGRTTYASIGGCYYAARLAVCEHLLSQGRQAGAFILRETHPGYLMPVGVWNVREHVRAALRTQPKTFDRLEGVMEHLGSRLDIPLARWTRTSALLADARYQRRLDDFL